jgi:hypothetical protein
VTPQELSDHLRTDHDQAVDGSAEVLAFVHDAMHNSRAVPGHFHDNDQVRRLWDATARIAEVDTGEHT